MPIFKRTFSQDLDLLEQHLTKDILSQTDCNTTLTKLRTKFENAFNSEFKERMQKYTRFNAQSFQDAMICNMDSIGKYMLEIILHQQRTPQLLKQKKLMQTQEDHSNPIQALNVDSLKVDLVVIQNTCSEKEDSNSETASSKSVKESSLDYATKDVHAIKYKMSKAKERCMAYFRSLHSHLQVLSKEDLKGTRIEHGFKRAFMSLFGQDDDTFTSTMLLNVDQLQKQLDKDEFQEDGSMAAFLLLNNQFQKFINSQFSLDYDSQMTDNYFVECNGIEVKHFRDTLLQHMGNVKKSVAERTHHQRQYDRGVNKRQMQTQENVQDDSSRSGNDTDADDADIIPIYDEEPMDKRSKTIEQTTSLLANNADLKAQIQEKVFAIAALKNGLRKLKGNSVDTKNSSKNMPRFSSNDMVRNHYLDEARKNTQERDRNSKPSVMPSARFQSTDDGNKPKPRSTNHSTRSLPVSKSSCVMKAVVPTADHSNNSNSFSNSKHFVCSTCHKCVFNANHDVCIIKFLKEVNSHAKIRSNKTRNSNKPVEEKSHTQKPVRQIFTGHRFSPNKTSVVYEKTSPRSDLWWKPTGRICKTISLRWVPTGKIRFLYKQG
ncbi:hypothetical protein Tco_0468587 [Tanacetum coccineum]